MFPRGAAAATMTDANRGDDDDVGWFPFRVLRAGRRGGASPAPVTSVGTAGTSDDLGRAEDTQCHRTSDGGSDEPVSTAKMISVLLLLGGLGVFFLRFLDLWVLSVAFGDDLTATVCNVLAGILVVNIGGYELLRCLVSNRNKVTRTVGSWPGWMLWSAWDAGFKVVYVSIDTVESLCVTVINKVKTVFFWIWDGARRSMERMALCAADFMESMIISVKGGASYMFETTERARVSAVNSMQAMTISIKERASCFLCAFLEVAGIFGVYAAEIVKLGMYFTGRVIMGLVNIVFLAPCRFVVGTVYFIKTKMFEMWRGADGDSDDDDDDDDDDEHAVCWPRTTDQPTDATEAVDVVPLRRSRRIAIASEQVERPIQDMTLNSGSGLAYSVPSQAMLRQRYVGQAEGVGDTNVSKKEYRASTPRRLSTEKHETRSSTRIRGRVKVESHMTPCPKVEPTMDSLRSGDGECFSHISPNIGKKPSLQENVEMGGCENSSEDSHRGFVASVGESNTKIKTETVVAPSGRGPCDKVEQKTETARFAHIGRCSHVPPETEGGSVVKREQQMTDSSAPMAGSRGDLAPLQASVGGARNRTTIKREISAEIDGPARGDTVVKREQQMTGSSTPMVGSRGDLAPLQASGGGARNRATIKREFSAEIDGPARGNNVVKREQQMTDSSAPMAGSRGDLAPLQASGGGARNRATIKREISAEIDGPARGNNVVKREQQMTDSSVPMAGSRGDLAPLQASVGGARNRATINPTRKNKRRRDSAAAAGQKAANRRRIDTTLRVHCCQADREEMVEMWVYAQSFDEASGEAVPGVFHYLPVTLIRKIIERGEGGGVYWYVQPGGRDEKQEWMSEEGGRVLWKVPLESLFQKAPAESNEGCHTCGKTEGVISWVPDDVVPKRIICDSCADAPRRNLERHYHARDLGFERARACGCRDW